MQNNKALPFKQELKKDKYKMDSKIDVVGIGNAIVDVLSQTEDSFLEQEQLTKNTMMLIDTEQAQELYSKMGPGVEVSGGSVANTIAALASLGGKTGFIGKVSHDQLGDVFSHDMRAMGVKFSTPALQDGPSTARCLIFVTPDAQRTMCTFLGASVWIASTDIDAELIESAKIIYLEGYLFDRDRAKKAFELAAEIAHKANSKVALTLSDVFCVERHREEFLHMIKNHVDILFANEEEIKALYETNDFDDAVYQVQENCSLAALTRGEKGSVIVTKDKKINIPATIISNVVDTTGAGDLYAAGFLYGYSQGKDLEICGEIASIAASEVLTHMGARPQVNLAKLLEQKLSATA